MANRDTDAERTQELPQPDEYDQRMEGIEREDVPTQAEEPIGDRLRRAWLNGFKEGVERGSYAVTEAWGRWDA